MRSISKRKKSCCRLHLDPRQASFVKNIQFYPARSYLAYQKKIIRRFLYLISLKICHLNSPTQTNLDQNSRIKPPYKPTSLAKTPPTQMMSRIQKVTKTINYCCKRRHPTRSGPRSTMATSTT